MIRGSKVLQPLLKPFYGSVRSKVSAHDLLIDHLPTYKMTELPNGLRVGSETRKANHVCVGIFVNAGSRNEFRFENGITHFFEHIVFKGTRLRSRKDIESFMYSTGGRFKTFTTREMCGYYAEIKCEHLTKVVGLLAECIFQNNVSCPELDLARETVQRKLDIHDIDHQSLLWDYMHGAAYHGTSLGQSVVGKASNLDNFTTSTICHYHQNFFTPTRTVLVAVGGVTHEQLHKLAEVYLNHLEPCKCSDNEYRFTAGDFRFRHDGMPLCHASLAFEAPSLCGDPLEMATLEVAAMYLGGWDRSQNAGNLVPTKIAQACGVGFGSAYKPFYIKYHDTGLWGIQFLGNRYHVDDLVFNIQCEFMNLCSTITECEVARGKAHARRRVLEKTEQVTPTCIDLATSLLYTLGHQTVKERLSYIDRVNAEKVQSMMNYLIYDRCPVVTAVGPCESLPEYSRIRAGQYWLRI